MERNSYMLPPIFMNMKTDNSLLMAITIYIKGVMLLNLVPKVFRHIIWIVYNIIMFLKGGIMRFTQRDRNETKRKLSIFSFKSVIKY